jgi:hypothetical protein
MEYLGGGHTIDFMREKPDAPRAWRGAKLYLLKEEELQGCVKNAGGV